MTCVNYHAATKLAWRERGGDWQDADGVAYGDQAFARSTVSLSSQRQVVEWDVTELARKWERGAGPAGGVYLRQRAGQRSVVVFHSREAEEVAVRPMLLMDWSDGVSTKSLPAADAMVTCTSLGGYGARSKLHVSDDRAAILVFPFNARSGASVRKARMVLSSDKQFGGASDIGVFRLTTPFAAEPVEKQGLASAYQMDEGIKSHPSVIFATDFESSGLLGDWSDGWSELGKSSVAQPVGRHEGNQFEPLSGEALKVTIKKRKKLGLNLFYRFKAETGSEPDEMYFRYYLRLGDNWAPSVGGKMPGFAGTYGRAGWGGRKPDGTDGWSTRGGYMVATRAGNTEHALGSYVYHAALDNKYGESWGWNLGPTGAIAKNRWYSVEQYVKLNEPRQADGILRTWVDGKLAFERTNIRFRKVDTLHIEALWMNVYHGGTTQAPSDLSLYIDNLVIASEYIGPAGGGAIVH